MEAGAKLSSMQLALLLFLIALTGTMLGRARFLKIYGEESSNLLSSGLTGAELAEAILRQRGITGVAVARGQGMFPDFYDPELRRISLAGQHFGGSSYSALGIAALQAGKAIQHHEGHRPLLWRTAAVRASVQLGLPLAIIALLAFFLGLSKSLFPICLLGWVILTFWNFFTVPTEVDAGLRAKRVMESMRLFRNLDERLGIERVTGAASTAYIDGVSVAGSWLARTIFPWLRKKMA